KAIGAFGANGYGEQAASAIMTVMKKYDADNFAFTVMTTGRDVLTRIGRPALPAIGAELESNNVNDRRHAIRALPNAQSDGFSDAIPYYLKALKDEDSTNRNAAFQGLAPTEILLRNQGMPSWPSKLRDSEKREVISAITGFLHDRASGGE